MSHIVLTEEQARVVMGASGSVEVQDPQGRPLALLQPLDPNEVEALMRLRQRRADPSREPAIPSARVQAMLRKLHEIDEREGITREKLAEVLRKLRAGEKL